jgi:hypothetical protein
MSSDEEPAAAGAGVGAHGGPLAPIRSKLRDIEDKLHAIRKRKKELEIEEDKSRNRSPPKDYSKPLKAYFHHPHLEYVYGEIVHSP